MDIVILLICGIFLFNYVHEAGHYLGHRLTGVKTRVFMVGVGPKLGERIDGLGGRVRFGLIPGASVLYDQHDFIKAQPLHRALIAALGPGANFLLMFLLFAVAQVFFTPSPIAVIAAIDDEKPAALAGVLVGDRIVEVDGSETDNWSDVGLKLASRVGDSGVLRLALDRGGETVEAEVAINDWQSERAWMDVFDSLGIQPLASPDDASASGIKGIGTALVDSVRMGLSSAWTGIRIVLGQLSVLNLTGGLQLTQLGVEANSLQLGHYLMLLGLFSFVFGMINSLPGPVVDGYHMIRGVIEWVMGRPLGETSGKVLLIVGIIFSFGFLPVVIIHDIMRIT